jgi:two-component system phosphate regulon response regulator PhoB
MPPHILIVEDEPDIQRLLEINLTREGHRVTVCGSGKQAWEKLAGSLPDLVLLDLMLPDLSGVELCRRARAERAPRGAADPHAHRPG